jgi:hypothetical protein
MLGYHRASNRVRLRMTSEDVVQVGQQVAAKYTPGQPANKALLLSSGTVFSIGTPRFALV